MTTPLIADIAGAGALVAGVTGGVFLAFSDFLMRGLVQAGDTAGMKAMQGLNRTVLRSAFLTVFLLLVPALLMLAAYSSATIDGPAQVLIVAAAAIYAVGGFLVTIIGNVPMNRRLDRLDADDADHRKYWRRYAVRWTRLNHIRTMACLLAATCLAGAAQIIG